MLVNRLIVFGRTTMLPSLLIIKSMGAAMPPAEKKRGMRAKGQRLTSRKKITTPVSGKEFNFVLQISKTDSVLLNRYQDVLVQGAAGYAEDAYNYLFDNPDIADALYAYERNGGSIGEFVRAQLQHMLGLLNGSIDDTATAQSESMGRSLHQSGIKPVWTLGSYRLFLEHLQHLIATDNQIDAKDREQLGSALVKIIFRDAGITCEAYWRAALEKLTEQRDELGIEQNNADQLLGNIPQLLWSVDVETNRISYASAGTLEFCKDRLEAPIPCFFRIDGSERERVLTAWQQVIDGESVQLEVRVIEESENDSWFRLAFYPVKNRRGRVLRVHCLMEDVTASRSDRQRLEQLSTTDEITGLANRALWYDRLALATKAARRTPGASVVVMTLDINQFKMYNDSLGQMGGNEILRQVADRLRKVVRDSDTLARVGGDEFGIILSLTGEAEQAAEKVARKLGDSMAKPFLVGDRNLCLSIATGIALFPQHGDNPDSLASHAGSAMYRAKWNSTPFVFYESGANSSAKQQLQYSGQLHGALEREEFVLHYQPKIDMLSRRLTGAEALIRWRHPQQGIVLPQQFIPVAEQLGMIMPITDWVLTQALRECQQWSNNNQLVPVSINVSARSFQSPGLLKRIEKALSDAGVEGKQLEIEITEGTLMQDLDQGAEVLNQLSALGIGIAIDDFGTGYSSLAYLKRLPITTLKIDQSFLGNMQPDSQDAAIVRSIIDLGHNLQCKVVAEGVEDQSVLMQLQQLGCDSVQGFHISKPLPSDGFVDWVSKSHH